MNIIVAFVCSCKKNASMVGKYVRRMREKKKKTVS